MNALVMDDSRSIRALLHSYLSEGGFRVWEASHGKEGLEHLEKMDQCHLVLADWNMPVMSGLDFLHHLRSHPDLKDLPLLMVTQKTNLEDVRKAIESGANEYLMKPFTRESLFDKLKVMGFAL